MKISTRSPERRLIPLNSVQANIRLEGKIRWLQQPKNPRSNLGWYDLSMI
jgi:hypothetical protein